MLDRKRQNKEKNGNKFKREELEAKTRRKKERKERRGRLNYKFSFFGATCIRGDFQKHVKKMLLKCLKSPIPH